jgi:hypothetical protein
MHKVSLPCLALCLLSGCAAQKTRPPSVPAGSDGAAARSAAPVPAAVQLSMHVEALSQRERRQYLLRASETLHTGDGVALFFKVDRPAYAYVAMVSPDGTPTLLYPTGSEQPLSAGVEKRIPREGEWLVLDDRAGQENLFVIASAQPLSETDPGLCRSLGLPCATPTSAPASPPPPPPPPPRPPPGNLDIKNRGRKHKLGPILVAETDEGGVAVLRFSFQHER